MQITNNMSNLYSQNAMKNNMSFGQIVKDNAREELKISDGVVTIISGPSGVGKGTIIKAFRDECPDFFSDSVSCTTRAPREGEKNGVHYNFLSVDEFKKDVNDNKFVEYNEVYPGKFYGTRYSDVQKAVRNAKHNVLLELDVDGAQKAKKELEKMGYPVMTIFIKPDSIDRLEGRLIKRGTETPETIKQRVGKAASEVEKSKKCDVIIQNNDDVPENVKDLKNLFYLA